MPQYEEWQVTGMPRENGPPYLFTWSPRNSRPENPRYAAWKFVRLVMGKWFDGPYLKRRVVIESDWHDFGMPAVIPPHATCLEITVLERPFGSEWVCTTGCPAQSPVV